MKCFVYKSLKKQDTYLYLSQKDKFHKIPDQLLHLFGKPEFAFEFDLTENRKLAVADAKQVITSLNAQGYYLQIPPQNNLPA